MMANARAIDPLLVHNVSTTVKMIRIAEKHAKAPIISYYRI